MLNNTLIVSIIVGIVAGYFYGLSFLLSRREAHLFHPAHAHSRHQLISFLLTTARFSILALLIFYLLRYSQLNVILILALFIITFWLVIIVKGSYINARP